MKTKTKSDLVERGLRVLRGLQQGEAAPALPEGDVPPEEGEDEAQD